MKSEINLRLEDFKGRAEFSPGDVLVAPTGSDRYIPIHPMADDVQTLNLLEIEPSDCHSVDSYWEVGDKEDVVLLQVQTQEVAMGRRPGLYARWADGEVPIRILLAIVDEKFITRKVVEEVIGKFSALRILEVDLDSKLVRL